MCYKELEKFSCKTKDGALLLDRNQSLSRFFNVEFEDDASPNYETDEAQNRHNECFAHLTL